MSMVERVAQAMGEADKWSLTDASPDYRSHIPAWVDYADMARAAIEAMRAPTDEMLDAMNDVDVDATEFAINVCFADLKELYHTAIDAALKE